MPQYYQIPQFYGIQQQQDSSLLPPETAYDARNMDTTDGNLRVAKGYVRHIDALIPNRDRILRLIASREEHPQFYIVAAEHIYAFSGSAWESIYEFPEPISGQVDYLQTMIGLDDYIIVATGSTQMVKIKIKDNTAVPFGTGLYSFEGTVTAYDSASLVVTLSSPLSAEALRHAPLDGIAINGGFYEVATADGATVTLKEEPEAEIAAGNTATIRGGGSDAPCNFVDMYYSRLLSAGDPNNPCRLYWSAVVGDGRSIEDWLIVDGAADASGGYVEVGDASGDAIIGFTVLSSQVIIFKRFSVYRLYGDRPSSFKLERIENYSQPMSNSGCVIKYDAPFYMTMDGLTYYDGNGITPMGNGVRYLNRFMQEVDSIAESKAIHCNNKLYFTCRTNPESTYDDSIIVYDIGRAAFMIRDGFLVADLCSHGGKVYMVNDRRYLYRFDEGDTYDGNPVNAYWQTQPTDMQYKLATKQIKEILFRGEEGIVLIDIIVDGRKILESRRILPDNSGFTDIPVRTDKARVFALRFSNEVGGRFGITGGIDVLWEKENRP